MSIIKETYHQNGILAGRVQLGYDGSMSISSYDTEGRPRDIAHKDQNGRTVITSFTYDEFNNLIGRETRSSN